MNRSANASRETASDRAHVAAHATTRRWRLLFAVAVLVPAVLTIALASFWGWVESMTEIESLGHSGPSSWCYNATYVVVIAIAFTTIRLRESKPR